MPSISDIEEECEVLELLDTNRVNVSNVNCTRRKKGRGGKKVEQKSKKTVIDVKDPSKVKVRGLKKKGPDAGIKALEFTSSSVGSLNSFRNAIKGISKRRMADSSHASIIRVSKDVAVTLLRYYNDHNVSLLELKKMIESVIELVDSADRKTILERDINVVIAQYERMSKL